MPGGRGYVVLTDALLEVVTGVHRELPEFARLAPEPDSLADPEHMLHGYGGPAYEVMYLLDAPDEAIPGFKARLAGLGDSLVVVGGDALWNIHVHVDDAGAADRGRAGHRRAAPDPDHLPRRRRRRRWRAHRAGRWWSWPTAPGWPTSSRPAA